MSSSTEFHWIFSRFTVPWNFMDLFPYSQVPWNSMKFHGTSDLPENNSMEFHGILYLKYHIPKYVFLLFNWWLCVIWPNFHINATYCIDFNVMIRILNTPVSPKIAQGQRKWHAVNDCYASREYTLGTQFAKSSFDFMAVVKMYQ